MFCIWDHIESTLPKDILATRLYQVVIAAKSQLLDCILGTCLGNFIIAAKFHIR